MNSNDLEYGRGRTSRKERREAKERLDLAMQEFKKNGGKIQKLDSNEFAKKNGILSQEDLVK